jgi:hypothetical protein
MIRYRFHKHAAGLGIAILILSSSAAIAGGVTRTAPGCTDKATFEKIVSLLVSGDTRAYANFMAQMTDAGVCRMLPAGTPSTADDSTWSGMVCVRPNGESSCYWTNTENYRN